MEVQLEEEYEDKQKVLREKRDLESKLTTLSDQVSGDRWLGPGRLPAPSRLRDGTLGRGQSAVGRGERSGNMEGGAGICGAHRHHV